MKPFVLGAIFARGGSKGVLRKNIRPLAGKPLIAYAIDAAKQSRLIDKLIVSTDDQEIANVALEYGAEVPFLRPAELATDDAPEWLAWQHAIRTMQKELKLASDDVFVSIPTTSPLRASADIDTCINKLIGGNADVTITVTPALRNPYFNMVTLDSFQTANVVIRSDTPIYNRQAAPLVYDITTVAYAARMSFVLNANALFAGTASAVIVPQERSLDIDSEMDFRFAEFLISSGIDKERHL